MRGMTTSTARPAITPAVRRGDHVEYLHDGDLHHPYDDHDVQHARNGTEENPDVCRREGKGDCTIRKATTAPSMSSN